MTRRTEWAIQIALCFALAAGFLLLGLAMLGAFD